MQENYDYLDKLRMMRRTRHVNTPANEADTSQTGMSNEEKIETNDAGNTTSQTTSEKNTGEEISLMKAFGEFLSNILRGLTDLFKDFFQTTGVKIDYLFQTDKGFITEYNNAKKKYEPSPGQELTLYPNINPKKITDPANRLEKHIKEVFTMMQGAMIGRELPKDHILNLSADEYKKHILTILGCPKPDQFKGIGDWVKYLKTDALGDKKVVVVRPSDIPAHENIAIKSVSALRGVVSGNKNDVAALTNELNRAFNAVSTNKNLPDEARNRSKRYANRAKALLEDYKAIQEVAYNVYFINIMQSRNVLNRMYKINN